jgi:hypothetical protein
MISWILVNVEKHFKVCNLEVENEILETRFMDFNPKKVEIIKPQEVFML